MSARGDVASTSAAGKGKKCGWTRAGTNRICPKKPTELLSESEFRECFHIPNDISMHLVDDAPTSTKKESPNAIFFKKEQFNAGLRLPLPSFFKQFLHFTKIPSTFIHPNTVRVLMGCNILDMPFHLNLYLLEVLFVYTIKMSGKGIFSLSAQIPSLQLVTRLSYSNKGGAKGHILLWGLWPGLVKHLDRDFHPRHTLSIPGRIDFFLP